MLVVTVSNIRAKEHTFAAQRRDARPHLACAGFIRKDFPVVCRNGAPWCVGCVKEDDFERLELLFGTIF